MKEGLPSETALRVASLRAVHQLVDRPLVFEDPLALRILDPRTRAAIEARVASRSSLDRLRLRFSPQHRHLRQLRFYLCIRSRLAEDTLVEAYGRGVRQAVVLGAGLDTMAYRSEERFPGLRVYEIDHPATQAWKRARLAQARIAIPDSLTFVPVDFARDDLRQGLAQAGFDFNRPSFVSWLGVSMYLENSATRTTLSILGAMAPGTMVVFDYKIETRLLPLRARWWARKSARRVAGHGEPFLGEWDPAQLNAELGQLGFGRIEEFDRSRLIQRYFPGYASHGRKPSGGRIIVAEVATRA